jgi:superoxide reductase
MLKFYLCEKCGNEVEMIQSSGVTPVCCGDKMTELVAGTVEASREKHIPVYEVKEGQVLVNVGSIDHPMVEEHFIEWIVLETKQGSQRKALKPGAAPSADFVLADGDEVVAAYEYCNLHGLWKAE